MSGTSGQPAAQPVFKKCPRCEYSLRGLPANHVCPECGLAFDERCELYRATNPKQILFVWVAIFGGGWIVLKNLPYMVNFAAASAWEKIAALAAVAWFVSVPFFVWFLVKGYRRGYEVAVTGDGLIIRLPGFADDLIPWANIVEASVKEKPEGKPQVASVVLKAGRRTLDIGGVGNVFPKRADAERFVDQVNQRVRTVDGAPPKS